MRLLLLLLCWLIPAPPVQLVAMIAITAGMLGALRSRAEAR
jgi:hypothetical protein